MSTLKLRVPAHLHGTMRQIGRGLLFTAGLNCFANLLMLIVPLFTMQVYDRVMSSRSTDTLMMLIVISVAGLVLGGVLDYIRSRTFIVLGSIMARRLNVPALQAAVVDTLGGGKGTGQTIRDLADLRSFFTGSAIAVPLDLLWVPMFLVVLFLLHPAYGAVACGAAVLLLALSIATDFLTRRPLAEANEAAARAFAEVGSTVRHAEAIEAMGLTAVADKPAGSFSGGMVRRLELAQALVNRPSLLLLDEPTVGLDPIARDSVWDQVERMQHDFGMAVLLTTHYMGEADALCDRVVLMHHGRLQAEGTPSELKSTVGKDATLEDVFRHYAGSDLDNAAPAGLREVRAARRTARRVG